LPKKESPDLSPIRSRSNDKVQETKDTARFKEKSSRREIKTAALEKSKEKLG
jgi:hypothetical protein